MTITKTKKYRLLCKEVVSKSDLYAIVAANGEAFLDIGIDKLPYHGMKSLSDRKDAKILLINVIPSPSNESDAAPRRITWVQETCIKVPAKV